MLQIGIRSPNGVNQKDKEIDIAMKYKEFLQNMVDLQRLANVPLIGEKTSEFSSYNKLSRYSEQLGVYENWSQNWDDGYDAPRDEHGGYIIAEMQGAGAIVRIWSADPKQGKIKIFIDGKKDPVIDMPFENLFGKGEPPFNFENLCYDASGGKNCFVPITYHQSCRVVLYDGWGMFYQVNYLSFPNDTLVEPFSLPLSAEQMSALQSVNDYLGGNLSTLPNTYHGVLEQVKTITIPAGESTEIFEVSGSGAIVGIHMKINDIDRSIGPDGVSHEWKALSDLCISMRWDKQKTDSVWSTLGGFFGTLTGLNPYASLPLGVLDDGTMYSNWYMPYEDGAIIRISNDGNEDYKITYTIFNAPLKKETAQNLLRFHAKWYRAKDPVREGNDRWPDATFLSLTGCGRYVGTSLHVYKEIGQGDPLYNGCLDNNGTPVRYSDWWWGEGDEKIFVDGEKFPSWFGTGCEDYFGYAWGKWNPFFKAYHAQPFTNGGMYGIGNRLNNRFHIIDSIPFQCSFEANLEKYHRDKYANWVFTNFFYLDKNATDGYASASPEQRTEYYEHPYPQANTFYEGEALKIIDTSGRLKAETQNMTSFGAWSNDEQFILKAVAEGNYVRFYINIPQDGNYKVYVALTKAKDFGIAQHYIDGAAIGDQIDLYNPTVVRTPEILLGEMFLEAGLHILEVHIAGKNEMSKGYFYGMDYLKFE